MKRMVPTEQIDLLERLAAQGVTPERIAGIEADVGDTQKMIADEYDATATYAVGDVCIHDGKLYQCNTAINAAEEWTAAHWTEIQVTELFRMENIIDEDGHKRFQEWNISTDPNLGITFTYAKASLSGTHLMLVLAGSVENATELIAGKNWGAVSLPSWVMEKIVPVWGSYIETRGVTLRSDDWGTQSYTVVLHKASSNTLQIVSIGSLTLSADRSFRIQFDLLID